MRFWIAVLKNYGLLIFVANRKLMLTYSFFQLLFSFSIIIIIAILAFDFINNITFIFVFSNIFNIWQFFMKSIRRLTTKNDIIIFKQAFCSFRSNLYIWSRYKFHIGISHLICLVLCRNIQYLRYETLRISIFCKVTSNSFNFLIQIFLITKSFSSIR